MNDPADNDPASKELRQFVEQWNGLDAERKEIVAQQKEVFAEAKARGYNTKILKKVIAERNRDKNDLEEEEAIKELYNDALDRAYNDVLNDT